MQHTSLPFTLAFGPQGCMAEVKGRVVAVWCRAEWSRLFWGWVDFPQFIPHNGQYLLSALAAHWHPHPHSRAGRNAGGLCGHLACFQLAPLDWQAPASYQLSAYYLVTRSQTRSIWGVFA